MELTYRLVKGSRLTHLEGDTNTAFLAQRELKAVFPGPILQMAGKARWYPAHPVTVLSMYVTAGVAPTGTSVLTLRKNGTSIGTVTLTGGSYKSSVVNIDPDVSMTASDYLTADITTADGGEDFTLFVQYSL